jgi:hypothetical protein
MIYASHNKIDSFACLRHRPGLPVSLNGCTINTPPPPISTFNDARVLPWFDDNLK